MIKKIILFLVVLFVYSCHPKQTAQHFLAQDSLSVATHATKESHEKIDIAALPHKAPTIEYDEGNMLLPNVPYRVENVNEIGTLLQEGIWLALHKDGKGHYVQQAVYSLHDEAEEPCSGMPTQTIVTAENSLLIFKIPNVRIGPIDAIAIKKPLLVPDDTLTFTFQGSNYQLLAQGIDPQKYNYQDTPNAYYQLAIAIDNTTKTFFYQDAYNDTVTEILFIGDLDADGKLDFILSSPKDYEEERIILILSSASHYYEASRQFDC